MRKAVYAALMGLALLSVFPLGSNLTLTAWGQTGPGGGGGSAGATWTVRAFNDTLYDITYGNGTFVVVGQLGTILTSRNGITWTVQASGTSNDLNAVTYENGAFVAVGEEDTLITSLDGITWTARTSGTSAWLNGVAYGNGTFTVAGGHGIILTSP